MDTNLPSLIVRTTLAAGFLVASSAAYAASPYGTWLRPSNGAHVKVFKCGGGIGMRVTKSKTPSKVGKTIMCGAKKTGANTWTGNLLNLDDGQTYSGKVKVNGNSMSLSGCILGGIICKSDNWRRIR